ncbi:hypothetical protein THAOC_36264, partial [Thalassiosira oceanica]
LSVSEKDKRQTLKPSMSSLGRKRVGDYELYETLGVGTFATVRRAVHTTTNKEFAVKCLDKSKIEEQHMTKVLASKTKLYLVLELVTGGELFRLLVREKGFSEDRARFFFKQLVEGVKECHGQGICHRDLKPENLLLDGNGDLKITDFGLSALHNNNENATQTSTQMLHTTCGSPHYVAPEILQGEGYDGRKADIWSMGVIAYVLVTGKLPFENKV